MSQHTRALVLIFAYQQNKRVGECKELYTTQLSFYFFILNIRNLQKISNVSLYHYVTIRLLHSKEETNQILWLTAVGSPSGGQCSAP